MGTILKNSLIARCAGMVFEVEKKSATLCLSKRLLKVRKTEIGFSFSPFSLLLPSVVLDLNRNPKIAAKKPKKKQIVF
jgi:hypothetical protein